MIFYSGFSFADEASVFDEYLHRDDYTAAGFSYGAIKAAEHVAASHERIDRLQLFSPAFFQDRPEKFKRLQMMGYNKDKTAYLTQFRQSCFEPYVEVSTLSNIQTSAEELEALLYHVWEPKLLEQINKKGTRIEVYLGGEDHVVNADTVREFFRQYAAVYLIKKANHFLQEH